VDIIEFSKILRPISSPSELSLEFAGLLLAILSFSGAIHKIENALKNLRDRIYRFLPIMRVGISGFYLNPKNIKRNGKSLLSTAVMTVIMCVVLMFTEPETRTMLVNIYALILPWVWWKAALLIILTPIILYLEVVVFALIFFGSIYALLTAIWFFFWLLSRPPAGIMGSIGLGLTAGTFSIKLFAA
jgi:hypothetical protein